MSIGSGAGGRDRSRHHQFWTETVSFRDDDLFRPSFVRGYRQLTDLYLLGLATKKRGRLVTFDSTIPLEAVVGATPSNLHVIAAAAGEPSAI